MALKLKCPCGERLTAPESAAGKRGKCSKCGQTFIIPAPAAVAAPKATSEPRPKKTKRDDDDIGLLGDDLPDLGGDLSGLLDEALDDPLPAPSTPAEPTPAPTAAEPKRSGNWRTKLGGLSLGIKLILGATVLNVIATFVAILAPFVAAELGILAIGAALLGGILATLGRLVCLTAPKQIKGKGFLIAAIACDLSFLALTFAGEAMLPRVAAGIAAALLPLATFILFILFVREVGESLGQDALVESGSEVIYAVLIAGFCLVGTLAPILGLFCLLAFVFFVCAAVWKYIMLLLFAAECVEYAAGRR